MTNLEDERARGRIVSHLDVTFLVEAGAGSGKTSSLVERMVALIRTGKASVEQIAAITFTRKAASELRLRFQLALEKALATALAGEAVSAAERDGLEAALGNLNLCFIGTIHSFCGRLLRERPLEARIDPGFREIEEDEDLAFADACWDDYLIQFNAGGRGEPLDRLATMGINVEDLRVVYHKVSAYPDVEIAKAAVERPDFDLARTSLFELVDEALPWLPAHEPDKGWDKLQEAVRQTQRLRQRQALHDDSELVRVLERLYDKKLDVTQNRWTDKAAAKELKEKFAAWQDAVLMPLLRQWREYKHPYVIDFVEPAVEYCRTRRHEAGLLNFQDLLMNAAELLRNHAEVRRYFHQRYQRLFVDEFQDTDPIQAEVMFLLTGAEANEGNWRNASPQPGSLFIVGDPKQSIYRFRRADIATYNYVKARIEESGEVLRLSANFRSVNSIGRFVDGQFKDVFPEEETIHQAKFIRLATRRSDPEAHFGVYKISHPKSLGNKDAVVAADAQRIAEYIRFACAGNVAVYDYNRAGGVTGSRPATPGDFMILTHRKDSMHQYGEQLEQYGIPSEVVDSQQSFRELHDLAVLTQCLANPADQLATVATLRGILFGVSDNSLYHYKREGHSFSLFHRPAAEDLSDVSRPVQRSLERLRQYWDWTRRMPAVAALERILADTGFLVYTALQPGGMARAGMLTTLLQHLNSQPDAALSWARLARVVADLDAKGGFPSASLYPGRRDVVRVMNLHKAKGLEAPVVFLAAPCGYSEHEPDSHVNRQADSARGYFVVDKAGSGVNLKRTVLAQPRGFEHYAQQEGVFLRAERDRLLYVATTRPRQLLVVSQWQDMPQKDPWSPLSAMLKTAPELPQVAVQKPPSESLSGAVQARDWLLQRSGQIASMAQPTFVRTSVTTEVKKSSLDWLASRSGADVVEASRLKASEAEPSVQELAHPHPQPMGEPPVQPSLQPRSPEHRGGRGAAFGSAVHRSLEALGKGLSLHRLPAYVKLTASEEGVLETDLDAVLETVQGVLGSHLWQRAVAAKQRLHEVPFVLADTLGDAGRGVGAAWVGDAGHGVENARAARNETAAAHDQPEGQGDRHHQDSNPDHEHRLSSLSGPLLAQKLVIHGVIDLAFEEEDGWVIVDFKTDGFEAAQEPGFVEHYRPQVAYYARVWHDQFGHPVKEIGLYFTNRQRYVIMEP